MMMLPFLLAMSISTRVRSARLTVFVGHVVRVHVLADVLEVLLDRLADRNFHKAQPQPFAERFGV